MKKIIAVIDIDGVITNLDFMIFKNISSKIINIGHHHTVDNKLLNDIFFKICLSVAKNSRLRPDVKEVITALKNNGVDVEKSLEFLGDMEMYNITILDYKTESLNKVLL